LSAIWRSGARQSMPWLRGPAVSGYRFPDAMG
jgi:hypothetical protein